MVYNRRVESLWRILGVIPIQRLTPPPRASQREWHLPALPETTGMVDFEFRKPSLLNVLGATKCSQQKWLRKSDNIKFLAPTTIAGNAGTFGADNPASSAVARSMWCWPRLGLKLLHSAFHWRQVVPDIQVWTLRIIIIMVLIRNALLYGIMHQN